MEIAFNNFYKELHNGVEVEIKEAFSPLNDFSPLEPKMKATIFSVSNEDMDGVVEVKFAVNDYKQYNKKYEKAVWRKDGGDVTATEAEVWSKNGIENFYFTGSDNMLHYFKIEGYTQNFPIKGSCVKYKTNDRINKAVVDKIITWCRTNDISCGSDVINNPCNNKTSAYLISDIVDEILAIEKIDKG